VRCFSALELELHKRELARYTVSPGGLLESASPPSTAEGHQKGA
jgi:hypothetical protein